MKKMKKSVIRVVSCLSTVALLVSFMCMLTFSASAGNTIKLGDVNSDGDVNMKDVLAVRKYVAGLTVTMDMVAADVNDDGSVNMKDVLAVRKHVAGIALLGEKEIKTTDPTTPSQPTQPSNPSGKVYYEDYDPKSGIDYFDPTINFIEGTGNTLGVWWWLPQTDETKMREYLDMMKKNQVTEVYYECYPWLYATDTTKSNPATLHTFATIAAEYGIRVAVLYDDRSVLKGNQNKMALYQRFTPVADHEYTFKCTVSNLKGDLGLAFYDAGETVTTFTEGANTYTFKGETAIKYLMLVGDRSSYTVSNVSLVDKTANDGVNLLKNGNFTVTDTRDAEFGWVVGLVENWSIENNACTVQNGFTPFNKVVEGFVKYKQTYPNDGVYAVHCDVEPKNKTEIEKYVNNFIPDIAAARSRGVPVELDLSCNMTMTGGENITYDDPKYGTITGIYNIIAANCDCMCLMSYRDTAGNIFGCGSEPIKSSEVYHTKLLFGIELGDSGEGDKVDFSAEGLYTAWSELYKLDQKLKTRDFGKEEGKEFQYGYAIHSEATMKNLRKHWGNPIADPTVK